MGKSRRIDNVNGAAKSYLKVESKKDSSGSAVNSAIKSAPKSQQQLVSNVLDAIKKAIDSSDSYQLILGSKNTDVILGRIASLLDEFRSDLADNELNAAKEEILKQIKESSGSSILKNFLVLQIAELFDNDAKKEDIEELKVYLAGLLQDASLKKASEEASETQGEGEESSESTYSDKEVQSTSDEKEGDYKDSTIAANFNTLQNYVEKQVTLLNENIKKIPGGIGFGKVGKVITAGFATVLAATKNITSKIGSFAKKTFSGIASVTKAIGGGALNGIKKVIGGIGTGVVKVASVVKGIGSGIKSGFTKIGSGIKSFGSRVGGAIASPFKKIGSFFKPKADKVAAKKEKMRERFMNFMMGLLEKLWNFLEPILSKLKIYMLATLIPIILIAAKVLLIVAAITALIVGIVLAVMWVKNKLIPKVKELVLKFVDKVVEWWNELCEWSSDLWDSICEIGEKVGKFFVYIFKDMWIDLGKWLWKKMIEFGEWIKEKLIDPVVNFIDEKIVQPIANFYKEKILPHILPFIDSIKSLIGKIKQAFAAWDTSKSIWENLKNISSIIVDSLKEWWETSPFKVAYETYIAPVVESLKNLMQRIKDIWSKFNWDENKSFVDNLMSFWDKVKQGIKEWWEGSPIKTAWDKIADWFSDLWGKLKEKFEESGIGLWLMNLKEKIKALIEKMGNIIWDFPGLPYMRPFGFLVGKPFSLTDAEKEEYKKNEQIAELEEKIAHYLSEIDKGNIRGKTEHWYGDSEWDNEAELKKLQAELAKVKPALTRQEASLAAQQVLNAMESVNSLNSMSNDTNVELQKAGAEMSEKAEKNLQQTYKFLQQQLDFGSLYLLKLDYLGTKIDNYGKDPNVVPVPLPYGPLRNAAMMESY